MMRILHKDFRKKHRGVALVTALLVVSLATIMAVALTSRQYIDIRRTGNMMQSDQAYLDAIASETFVGQLLANFRSSGQSNFDDINLFDLALVQLSTDMSDEARIVSLQADYPESRFNVNTLVLEDDKPNPKQKEMYRRLLKYVIDDLGGDRGQVDGLVSSLIDWIDENEEALIDGAEDSIYESKEPPYKAANRMLTSISELRLVEGYTEELLDGIPADEEQEIEAVDGLLAYVTALPDRDTTINVNAVSKHKIFMAMSNYLDLEMAEELISGQPYEEKDGAAKHPIFDTIKAPNQTPTQENNYSVLTRNMREAKLDIKSSYFIINSAVTVGKTTVDLNSLIYVRTDGGKLEVISRAIGTDGI